MLFVMMIVNLVCWTPWWIYTLLYTNLGDIQMFHNLFPKVKAHPPKSPRQIRLKKSFQFV